MPTKIPLPSPQNCAHCGEGKRDGQLLVPLSGMVKTAQMQLVPLKNEKSIYLHFPACATELGKLTRASLNRKQKKVVCGSCHKLTPKNDLRVDIEEKLICPTCREKRGRAIVAPTTQAKGEPDASDSR